MRVQITQQEHNVLIVTPKTFKLKKREHIKTSKHITKSRSKIFAVSCVYQDKGERHEHGKFECLPRRETVAGVRADLERNSCGLRVPETGGTSGLARRGTLPAGATFLFPEHLWRPHKQLQEFGRGTVCFKLMVSLNSSVFRFVYLSKGYI